MPHDFTELFLIPKEVKELVTVLGNGNKLQKLPFFFARLACWALGNFAVKVIWPLRVEVGRWEREGLCAPFYFSSSS